MKKNHHYQVHRPESMPGKELTRDWSGLRTKEQYWPHSPWRAFGMAFQA